MGKRKARGSGAGRSVRSQRAQSALEYLTTYSWVLILIVIVLVVLYSLGLINPSGSAESQCTLPPTGISCINYYMSSTGVLSITLLQNSPAPVNITALTCNSNNTPSRWQVPYNPPLNQVYLTQGSSTTINIQCYAGASTFSGNPDTVFTGYVFVNYTDSATMLPHTVKGTILLKVSRSGTTTTTTTSTSTSTTSTTIAPFSIDGFASTNFNSNTGMVTFTDQYSNDILILVVAEHFKYGSGCCTCLNQYVSSISSTASIPWVQRASMVSTPGCTKDGIELEEWYAKWSGSGSITITLNMLASDQVAAAGVAVSGANYASPFDPSASLPGVNLGSSSVPTVSISTSNPNDLLLGMLGGNSGPNYDTMALPFTDLTGSATNSGQSDLAKAQVDFGDYAVSSTQSGLAATWAKNEPNNWVVVGDALQHG